MTETIDLTSDSPGQRSEVIDVDSLPDRSPRPRSRSLPRPSGTLFRPHPNAAHFALPIDLEEFLVGGGVYPGASTSRRDYNFANGRVQPPQQQQHHHHHHRHQHLRHHHHHHLHTTIFNPPHLDYTLAAAFGNFVEDAEEAVPDASTYLAPPAPPPPPRKGFTRSPRSKDKLVCPQCEGGLHHSGEGRIYASRCGHVYCEACAVTRRAGKTALCAVKGCKRITPRSLVEIYP